MNAVEIQGLTKRYGAITAVDSLDLTVRQGELFCLLGVNGARQDHHHQNAVVPDPARTGGERPGCWAAALCRMPPG